MLPICGSYAYKRLRRPYIRFARSKLDKTNQSHVKEVSDLVEETFRLDQCLNANCLPMLCCCLHTVRHLPNFEHIKYGLTNELVDYYAKDMPSRMLHLLLLVGSYIKDSRSSPTSKSLPIYSLFHDGCELIIDDKEMNDHNNMICNNSFCILFSINKSRLPELIRLAAWKCLGGGSKIPTSDKELIPPLISASVILSLSDSINVNRIGINMNKRIEKGFSHHRNFVDSCLRLSKKDRLLTFNHKHDDSFLHHFVDVAAKAPSEPYPSILPCQIFWALLSREKDNRIDVFDEDKNLITYSIKPQLSCIMTSLIPVNSGKLKSNYIISKTNFTTNPNETIYCNGHNVTDKLCHLTICTDSFRNRYFVDEFNDERGADCKQINFPSGEHHKHHTIHYVLVRDILTEHEVGKLLDLCMEYRHELLLPALIFILRFKMEIVKCKKEKQKFDDKKERYYNSDLSTSIVDAKKKIEEYLKCLGESLKFHMPQMSLSQLKRFGWGKWPLVLEDGDAFFDDVGRSKRVQTRNALSSDYIGNEKKIRDLHLLHSARVMLFSQQS